MPSVTWDNYVSLAVHEIRHYGTGSIQIARRLRSMLEDVLAHVPEAKKEPVRRELDLLADSVTRGFPDPADQAFASRPDQQGIGS